MTFCFFHYAVVETFQYFDKIALVHYDTTTRPINDFFLFCLTPRWIYINCRPTYILLLLLKCDVFFHYAVAEAFQYLDNIALVHYDTTRQPTNDDFLFSFSATVDLY